MSRLNGYTLPLGPSDSIDGEAGTADYRIVLSSTVAGATSSATGETVLNSILIPANTFSVNDVVDVRALVRKTNTTNTVTIRMRIGSAVNTSGQLIGTSTFIATALNCPIHRRLGIRSATTQTVVFRTTVAAASDIIFNHAASGVECPGNNPGGCEYVAIDWTQDRYLVVTGQNTAVTTILQCLYLKLTN
jgi:hypothetical protein